MNKFWGKIIFFIVLILVIAVAILEYGQYFEKVILGMWMAVNEKGGTAIAARISGFDVCGKTGSTQVVSKETAKKLAETNSLTFEGYYIILETGRSCA